MKYLTKKDKYTQCNGCSKDKVFAETNKEIMISCGSDDDTSCGKQILVTFPEYIHYSSKLDELEDMREHFGILNSSHLSLNLPRSYQLKRSELLFKAHKILFPDDNIENESRHQGASSSSISGLVYNFDTSF